jgi:hypothetical protein
LRSRARFTLLALLFVDPFAVEITADFIAGEARRSVNGGVVRARITGPEWGPRSLDSRLSDLFIRVQGRRFRGGGRG